MRLLSVSSNIVCPHSSHPDILPLFPLISTVIATSHSWRPQICNFARCKSSRPRLSSIMTCADLCPYHLASFVIRTLLLTMTLNLQTMMIKAVSRKREDFAIISIGNLPNTVNAIKDNDDSFDIQAKLNTKIHTSQIQEWNV